MKNTITYRSIRKELIWLNMMRYVGLPIGLVTILFLGGIVLLPEYFHMKVGGVPTLGILILTTLWLFCVLVLPFVVFLVSRFNKNAHKRFIDQEIKSRKEFLERREEDLQDYRIETLAFQSEMAQLIETKFPSESERQKAIDQLVETGKNAVNELKGYLKEIRGYTGRVDQHVIDSACSDISQLIVDVEEQILDSIENLKNFHEKMDQEEKDLLARFEENDKERQSSRKAIFDKINEQIRGEIQALELVKLTSLR